MNSKNRKPNSRGAFLTIDDWQDDQPVTASWFDNPLWGTVGVIVAVSVLFSMSFVSAQAEANRLAEVREEAEAELKYLNSIPSGQVYESESFDQALKGLSWTETEPSMNYFANPANFDPSQKPVVQEKILKLLTGHSQQRQINMKVFSVWFDSKDHPRISALIEKSPGHEGRVVMAMSNLPNPVPALISEFTRHSPENIVYTAVRGELRNHNVSTDEILRQLADKLRVTRDPRQFECIVLAIKDMAWQSSDDPALKKLIATAMAAAGRNITTEQLDEMDGNVVTAIKKFSQFPETSDLIQKLSATKHVKNQQMPWDLTEPAASGKMPEKTETVASKVKQARDNKLHPRELLSHEDSELAQEFLWEGKLKGKSEFQNLNMSFSAASMNGFSKAGVSLIRFPNDYSAINPLLSVVQTHSTEITRERLSDTFLQRLDSLLANKLKDDLRLPSSSSSPASLDLAELLGGKKAALAIAQAGKKKPEVLREFKGMLAALIALNEPETYGMIVNAWVIHGKADGLENVGEAIEPDFIKRLQIRLRKLNAADKQQRRMIHFLIGALNQIGTSKSFPILEQLQQSKVQGFRKASDEALKVIRERSGRR